MQAQDCSVTQKSSGKGPLWKCEALSWLGIVCPKLTPKLLTSVIPPEIFLSYSLFTSQSLELNH